ncbi:MAG: BON domain-containing protein [Proteobacteria bacterium]|nr:BON domain-containing protein [Pseudomonadota bacterium]
MMPPFRFALWPQSRLGLWPVGLLLALGACAPAVVGAGAAVGVTAAQERGVKGALADTEIRIEINHLWFQESAALYAKVNLQVQERRVLLTGNVPDPEARLSAVRLAWQPKNVIEVINEIAVRDTSSLLDGARDAWISTELKARILVDTAIVSINYSIETVNQVVYLIGVAQSRAELDRVIAHAKDIAYVRRVIDYVRLKDDPARAS